MTTTNGLRVVFMGSADLSCPSLSALLQEPSAFSVTAVVTQPDRPRGRGLKLTPSPVKQLAQSADLPVLQPEKARDPDFIADLRDCQPDLVVVVAYGQILSAELLEIPTFGCINVHTSLLPKYRGAAPIQWAILNGENETGVTIMKMDQGLDTGPILSQERTPIRPEDTSASLHDRLAVLGADLLLKTIPNFVKGSIVPLKQPAEGASYAPKIKKQDGDIEWRQPAMTLWNKVRGLHPWPGASTSFRDDAGTHKLKILNSEVAPGAGDPGKILKSDREGLIVACGLNSLKILELQLEGGRPMDWRQFLAGHKAPAAFGLGVSDQPSAQ